MNYEVLVQDMENLGYAKYEGNLNTKLFGLPDNPKAVVRVLVDRNIESAQEEDRLLQDAYSKAGFPSKHNSYLIEFSDQASVWHGFKIPRSELGRLKTLVLVKCASD